MNATSLYVTTNQIILKANSTDPSSWEDLYRLLPYLRNSLNCVVCNNLLVEPHSPAPGRCHHHVCKACKTGKKKLKPSCPWCKSCSDYIENKSMKILLQCYKKMCQFLTQTPLYEGLLKQASNISVEKGASNLLGLIKEGTDFHDFYESEGGIPKSEYNILPCIYTNSSTQTLQLTNSESSLVPSTKLVNLVTPSDIASKTTPNINSNLYSVMYSGGMNKITIKRKPQDMNEMKTLPVSTVKRDLNEKTSNVFKRPVNKCAVSLKKGCRCGNATATPGKLTCCGQRCPCYVESKACIECKCRGCRNPHTVDGLKMKPIIANHAISYPVCPNPEVVQAQVLHHNSLDLSSLEVEPQFTFDPVGMETYKVVAGSFGALPLGTNLMMNKQMYDENVNL